MPIFLSLAALGHLSFTIEGHTASDYSLVGYGTERTIPQGGEAFQALYNVRCLERCLVK